MSESVAGIEGQLQITLRYDRQGVQSVDIQSSRPLQASRILIGKTPQQALQVIPSLYSVCAVAQSRAALACLQQALQLEPEVEAEQARDLLVLVETAREHVLRILLDWPPLFGQAVKAEGLPRISRLVNDFKKLLFDQGDAFSLDSRPDLQRGSVLALIDELEVLLGQIVFGCSPADWQKIDNIDALQQWARQGDSSAAHSLSMICQQGWTSQGISECPPLPPLAPGDLLDRLSQDDADVFIQQPEWQGQCQETTVLGRQRQQPMIRLLQREFGNALITRWVARLVELAQLPQNMRDCLQLGQRAAEMQNGHGIGQFEAVRGRLIHRVVLADDVISEYQIVAPTEWNFHPQGVLAQSLQTISARQPQELETLARLMVNAIDPCVGYQLSLQPVNADA